MDSRAWKTVGEREEEQERMNRMWGMGDGLGEERRMEWIAGTGRRKMESQQNVSCWEEVSSPISERTCCVPITFIPYKILPKRPCRELWWNDHAGFSQERCEKTTKETVNWRKSVLIKMSVSLVRRMKKDFQKKTRSVSHHGIKA